MSRESDIPPQENWFAGEDRTFEYRAVTGKAVEATAKAANGATSIAVKPLQEAIADTTVVRFPYGILATLTAAASVGDESIAVSALGGAIQKAAKGYQVQDITGWAIEWVLREGPAGAEQFTKTVGSGITLTTPTEGVLSVAIADSDTLALDPKTYYYTLRRTDDANEVALAYGDAVLRQPATRD